MGAWGTGPFDNDTVGDWFDDVLRRPVAKALYDVTMLSRRRGADRENKYDRARAAAAIMQALPDEFNEEYFKDAIVALSIIADDDDWVSRWRSVPRIKKSIQEQIQTLESLKQRDRRKRKY